MYCWNTYILFTCTIYMHNEAVVCQKFKHSLITCKDRMIRISEPKMSRCTPDTRVVDPDPHGSGNFAWIRIRNSENSELDPDPQ